MTAIIPLILQGLTLLPGLIQAFNTVFRTSSATNAQKAQAISTAAGTVIGAVGSISTGGQKETMQKAASVLPMFQSLTENLMNLAEASGQPGEQKQAYVTNIITTAMQGWEQLSTGGQHTTVEAIKPIVNETIDTLVPLLFPKDTSTVGLGTQSNG